MRSAVSPRAAAALRGHNGVTTSSTPSDASASRRSAAGRVIARSHPTSAAVKKLKKRQRMSATFTFLLACGLQLDYAPYGTSTADSIGRASIISGRHGNTHAPADYTTNISSTTGAEKHDQWQQLQTSNDHHYIDIRL